MVDTLMLFHCGELEIFAPTMAAVFNVFSKRIQKMAAVFNVFSKRIQMQHSFWEKVFSMYLVSHTYCREQEKVGLTIFVHCTCKSERLLSLLLTMNKYIHCPIPYEHSESEWSYWGPRYRYLVKIVRVFVAFIVILWWIFCSTYAIVFFVYPCNFKPFGNWDWIKTGANPGFWERGGTTKDMIQ